MSSSNVLQQLRARICAELDPVFDGVRSCALVGYPFHGNPGDSAIWLGEKAYFAEKNIDVSYACYSTSYNKHVLCELVPDGPIVIHGGGNFGDIWPYEQAFREHILSDFPDRRIIQMPQSVFFQDVEHARRFANRVRRVQRFTCFVRDTESLERYAKQVGGDVRLCPDMAFMLPFHHAPRSPSRKMLYVLRKDQEALNADRLAERDEWIRHIPTIRTWFFIRSMRVCRYIRRHLSRSFGNAIIVWMTQFYDAVARDRVSAAEQLLGTATVVVTDRLHGHIFCMLMGIPHVVLDNSYGKIHSFVRQWTERSPLVRLATSLEEASSIAATMERGG